MKIPIEVSARHIHLSQQDLDILFGKNYQLQKEKDLLQPRQFAAKETVKIIGKKNSFDNVRIIGPVRSQTQLEITITDSYFLGINPPGVKISGDLADSTGGLEIVGKIEKIKLEKGIIVAKRHLHIEPDKAKKINIKDGDEISIEIIGIRSVIFNQVVVRSKADIDALSFQLDTDEANASGVKTGDFGEIV